LPHQHTVPSMSQNIGTHQHYAAHRHPIGNHTHPVPFRKGYSVNSGNQPGNTNAVFVPGNSPAVAFIARNTAIWTGDAEGGPDTGSGAGGPGISDWDDLAGNSHWVDGNGAHTVSLGNVATTGGPTDSGVGANLPPFITLNFIVRIG
jgi:hypothetical protein